MDVEVNEGDGTAVLEVTLTPASGTTVTVAFMTANGSATVGEDYAAANGTLTFPPNVTSQGISFDIIDDHADESDETFFVTLSNATNAVISDVTGQVTILDNDDPAVNPPGPPLGLVAEAGDGEVTLSWSPPASDGGAAITGYEYRFAVGSAAFTDAWTQVPRRVRGQGGRGWRPEQRDAVPVPAASAQLGRSWTGRRGRGDAPGGRCRFGASATTGDRGGEQGGLLDRST